MRGPFYPSFLFRTGSLKFTPRVYRLWVKREQSSGYDTILSTTLLNRARLLTSEHSKLSASLAESFDARVAKRLGEVTPITDTLKEWDKSTDAISELQSLLDDPELDSELRTLALDDLNRSYQQLSLVSDKIKATLIPKHEFATLPCLLEIRPGAGGDEAGIFAFELLRMYLAFCSRKGFCPSIIKQEMEESSSNDRLTEAIVEIQTPGSYDILRTETGVHRVQRVPATEAKGRVHTSAVSVMILPSFPDDLEDLAGGLNYDDPNSDYYVNPQDVKSERMRASGAGGQHVNKTESAIRLTHIPTGIVVSMQESRSQHANRKKAWQILRARLADAKREAREKEKAQFRRGAMGGVAKMGRGDKIRTYNYGQSRCTDHRSGMTVHDLPNVLNGGASLDTIMDSVRAWFIDNELQIMIAEDTQRVPSKMATAKRSSNKHNH